MTKKGGEQYEHIQLIWMFHSKESNRTCKLQKNTVYKLQSIQFSTAFKPTHGRKANTNTSCFSTKLQMNYKQGYQ